MRTTAVIVVTTLALTAPALAQEPIGCDKFKWPIERERNALSAKDIKQVDSATDIANPPAIVALRLHPTDRAQLPSAPERAPKSGTFAGFVSVNAPGAAGLYSISLPAFAWLDVIQDGAMLKPVDFSGVTGCDGMRKVVRFNLAPKLFVVQLSGVEKNSIGLAILPVH